MSVDDGIAGIVDAVEDLGLENRTYVHGYGATCHLPKSYIVGYIVNKCAQYSVYYGTRVGPVVQVPH